MPSFERRRDLVTGLLLHDCNSLFFDVVDTTRGTFVTWLHQRSADLDNVVGMRVSEPRLLPD